MVAARALNFLSILKLSLPRGNPYRPLRALDATMPDAILNRELLLLKHDSVMALAGASGWQAASRTAGRLLLLFLHVDDVQDLGGLLLSPVLVAALDIVFALWLLARFLVWSK